MRALAIDYGTKRCGIAVTDPNRLVAGRLPTVPTENIIDWLKQYFKEEKVTDLILGLPLRLDGSETHATVPVKKFSETVANFFPNLNIHWIDERFTSKMAVQSMIQAGVPKKKRQEKGLVDGLSAVILLQEYLEFHP